MADLSTAPLFINADANQIASDIMAYYESITGKVLQPAQVERIVLQVLAYREKLLRDNINDACLTQLIDFSRAPMIDFVVALVGVKRLSAQAATVTLEFSIIAGHTGVTVPSGTRVQSADGKVIFATVADSVVPIGTFVADVAAVCDTTGEIGNSYGINTINSLLDPQAFITDVTNIDVSGGGSDVETDDQLRDRAKLAPDAFSNAGSIGAYKFWAKSASPDIIDVSVSSSVAGTVNIYPLVKGGVTTPSGVITAVTNTCSADKVRPLSDTVVVASPTATNYNISVHLAAFNGFVDADIIDAVDAALNDYAQAKMAILGGDIVKAEITKICMEVPGVYNVSIASPASDTTIDLQHFAKIGTVTVDITSHTDG
jgi:phage-related baseplate assembly protein